MTQHQRSFELVWNEIENAWIVISAGSRQVSFKINKLHYFRWFLVIKFITSVVTKHTWWWISNQKPISSSYIVWISSFQGCLLLSTMVSSNTHFGSNSFANEFKATTNRFDCLDLEDAQTRLKPECKEFFYNSAQIWMQIAAFCGLLKLIRKKIWAPLLTVPQFEHKVIEMAKKKTLQTSLKRFQILPVPHKVNSFKPSLVIAQPTQLLDVLREIKGK